MSLYQILFTFIFFVVNSIILYEDLLYRKIGNVLLFALLVLLAIWWTFFFSFSPLNIAPNMLIACILLILGISLHTSSAFLGAGDIKYAAIITLFLPREVLPLFVQNIGVLTLLLLAGWMIFLLGQIFALKPKNPLTILPLKAPTFPSIRRNFLYFIFDWVYIGFLLYLLLQKGILGFFQTINYDKSFYLIFSIGVFLLRPAIRYLLLRWKHRFYPLMGSVVVYFSLSRESSWEYVWSIFQLYLENMWLFAIIFVVLSGFIRRFFAFYDGIIAPYPALKKIHTAPYSFVIFGAFLFSFTYNLSLIDWIKLSLFG